MRYLQMTRLSGKPATAPVGSEPTWANWLTILILGVVWGGTFMVIALALRGYGPLTVAAARTSLGAISLIAVALAIGRPFPRDPRVWLLAVPLGIFSSALPFFLLAWGQQYVASAFAGLAMAALPLVMLPMAHFFTDERMDPRKSIGMIVGFAGALVLMGPGLRGLGGGSLVALGQAACIGASVCYAVASVLTRRCPPVDPVVLSALSLAAGALFLMPAMLWVEGVPVWQPGVSGWAILVLGFVPTAAATVLRVIVIRSAGSVFMSLVNYQVPLWSMMFGALVLGEVLPLRFFAALMLILTGLAISQWMLLKRLAGKAN